MQIYSWEVTKVPDFVVSTLLKALIPVSLPKCSDYLTTHMPHDSLAYHIKQNFSYEGPEKICRVSV